MRLPPSSSFDDIADSPKQAQHSEASAPSTLSNRKIGLLASSIAVCLAFLVVFPWISSGWLLLLDRAPGPHPSLPRSFWGLDRELQSGLPLVLLILSFSKLLGAAVIDWLLVFAALMIAAVSAGRLAGSAPLKRIAAGALYAVNPLVFDRVFAGQVGYLLAYAMLPLFVASVLRWRDDVSWRGARPALWLTLLVALTPHYFWIASLVDRKSVV